MEEACCAKPAQDKKMETIISQLISLEDTVSGLRNRIYSALERVDGTHPTDPPSEKEKLGNNGYAGVIQARITDIYRIVDETHSFVSELEHVI